MSRFKLIKVKTECPLWSGAVFKPGSTTKDAANVKEITVAILDIDGGFSLEEIEALVSGYRYLIHSSYSHRPDQPRFRVYLPLIEPVAAEDWEDISSRINQMFDGKICSCFKNPAQFYFYPSIHPDRKLLAFSRIGEGRLLNPYRLPMVAKCPEATLTPSQPQTALKTPENGADSGGHQTVKQITPEYARNMFDEVWSRKESDGNGPLRLDASTGIGEMKESEPVSGFDGGVDGSAMDFAVMMKLVKRGVSWSAVQEAFEADKRPGHFRKTMNAGKCREAVKWLKGCYEDAMTKGDSPEFIANTLLVKQNARILRRMVQESIEWKGVLRQNMLKALQAHITVYERCCSDVWGLSEFEGSEMSRLGTDTLRKHNKALVQEGWLEFAARRRGKSSIPQTFRFGPATLGLLEEIRKSPHNSGIQLRVHVVECPSAADFEALQVVMAQKWPWGRRELRAYWDEKV
jgi:hypothetical protein